MKINRRDTLKMAGLAAGAAALSPFAAAAAGRGGAPKRFVFFIYSNGFHPDHICPKDLRDMRKTDKLIDVELGPHKLPGWTAPLEKYKDRMTVLHGVNGRHCSPSHGTPFGCLAGLKKGKSPRGQTIDHALGSVLPPTPLPMLGIGLSQLTTMQGTPISYASSAAGASRPVPLFSDPRMLYQSIFGSVAGEKSRDAFLAETAWFADLIGKSDRIRKRLNGAETAKFETYLDGLRQIQKRRRGLMAMKEALTKFKPDYTEAFDNPEHSGQWWEANIDVGVAALQAGVTNVLTVDAGLSGPDGMPLDTFGIDWPEKNRAIKSSHDIGHWSQTGGSTGSSWLKVRHYSLEMLERIIQPLAATPEPNGEGTMLDNTLIVYTSDSGEVQHSHGNHWPFLLIGDLGGRIRSGRHIQFPSWGSSANTANSGNIAPLAYADRPHDGRTINALWATLLHAAGSPVDGFNLDKAPAGLDKPGPMEELLV
jgi:hypothetical protein